MPEGARPDKRNGSATLSANNILTTKGQKTQAHPNNPANPANLDAKPQKMLLLLYFLSTILLSTKLGWGWASYLCNSQL